MRQKQLQDGRRQSENQPPCSSATQPPNSDCPTLCLPRPSPVYRKNFKFKNFNCTALEDSDSAICKPSKILAHIGQWHCNSHKFVHQKSLLDVSLKDLSPKTDEVLKK